MTGRDLVIYILENHLENADVKDVMNNLLVTDVKYAANIGTGVATVRELIKIGKLDGLTIYGNGFVYNTNRRSESHERKG